MGWQAELLNTAKKEKPKEPKGIASATPTKNKTETNWRGEILSSLRKSGYDATVYRTKKAREMLEKDIGFETISDDLAAMNVTVNGIYKNWHDNESMSSTKSSVENMYNRLNAYEEYRKKYGNENYADVSETVKAYKNVLDDWDNISEAYGKFNSGEEYSNGITRLSELTRELVEKDSKYTDDYWRSLHDEIVARESENAESVWDRTKIDNRAWGMVQEQMRAWEKEKEEIEKEIRLLSGVRDATWKDVFTSSFSRGYNSSKFGDESFNKMWGMENEADSTNELLQSDKYQFAADGDLKEGISGALEQFGQWAYMLSKPDTALKVGGAAAVGAGTAFAIGQAGPQIALPEEFATVPAGAITGFKAGMAAVSAENALRVEAGHAYNEMIENGISHETAKAIALGVGTVNAALEMVQTDRLLDAFKVLNKGGATTVAKKIYQELIDRGVDVAIEVGQEVAQEGVTMLGAEHAHRIDKGEGLYTLEEVGERLGDTAKSSTLAFGAMNVPATVTNIATDYSKTKHAYANDVKVDDKMLAALIEEGKEIGGKSAQAATAIETAQANGKKVTTAQVERLIKANDKAEQTAPTTLEEAARGAVANRTRTASYETLEALSQNNEPITAEEVKKVTRFGEEGAKLVAELANRDGVTLNQAERTVKTAYDAGFTDLKATQVSFENDLQKAAFDAGKIDRGVQDRLDLAKAQEATVYKGTFHENEHTKNYTEAERTMISTFAKGLKMDISTVDNIIASVTLESGKEVIHEANAEHNDGKMRVSSTATKVLYKMIMHEGGHRMKQLAPTEFGVLMNALYERVSNRYSQAGMFIDDIKAQHDNAGITLDAGGYFEEFAVRELENIFNSAEEFNKWYAEISGNAQVKTAWQKFMDFISELIEDVKRFIAQSKMTKEERAEAKKSLAELEHIKELYANAFKAAENAVTERAKVQGEQSAETQKNTDTEGGGNFSLKTFDGKSIVWIEESGLTNKQLNNHRAVAEYIAQHIGEVYTIIESGQKVYIGEDLPQEYTQSKYTTYLRGVNKTAARGKNKAVNGLGELIETATNRRWEKTRHTHNKDAKYGIYRYDNSFAFPIKDNKGKVTNVRAFDVELLIRNASDGNKYLYDIVGIEENTTTEIGILERMTRLPDKSQATRDSVSINKIPQKQNSVKNDFSLKDSEGARRVQDKQNTDTNSSQNLEIKKNEQYNGSVSHSLKWHTDLNATQFKALEKEIRQIENHEPKRIADTDGCWYKGRMNGDDLFAIYSTADKNNPTILYERKGKYGKLELDILMDLLEDEENGTSINGKSSFAQRVSQGNWMPMVNSSQNNLRNLGGGGHNQNAGVLPGQSQRNGSRAFQNVVENLFRTQEENGRISEGKSYSLKDTENYSLKDDPRIRIKYSSTGIKLPKNEYAKFHQSTNTDYYKSYKTHEGLQYQSCVTDETHILYIYEDGGFDKYKVVARVDYKYEDVATAIMGVLNDGKHYKITDTVNEMLEMPEVRRSGYSLYNAYTKKRSGARSNVALFEEQSKSDTRGIDESGGGTPRNERGNTGRRLTNNPDINYSLKGGVSATEILDTIEGVQKGQKDAKNRLYKYVKDGEVSTRLYSELIEKYGAISKGENPHRDIQVPKRTAKDKKVSQTIRTILEAEATPDAVLPTIEKMVEDGVFSYDVYTDKKAIKDAEDYLNGHGWKTTLNDWKKDVEKGVVSKQHTVTGWALYNNAVNRAETTTSESERQEAMQTALEVLDGMVRHQRSAAQALQATRILKKLSPETQLYGVAKSVQAFQKELTDKYGKKAPDLKINEKLAEEFLNAETEEERAEIEKEIYKDIGRQMPSRFIDKWNAWRYLAMLGNVRTHIRNIGGNAFFAPVVLAKNLTATAIESAVNRVSPKKIVRGKALITGSKADKALLKAAWSDYGNVSDIISNGGKYNDSAMANQYIEEGRRIFKTKPLEWARKKNSALLEKEDMWFSKPHYAYALAQYCKANNITAEQIKRGKAIAPAREYAIKEAQKATYRDTNAFSQFVSSLGRGGEIEHVPKVVSMAVEGALPFRKTPANILVRGVEYSPIGLLKGLTYDLEQVQKGKMEAHEAIDNISAGLTGTGLLALGVLLAAQGLIRGHGEEDKDEKAFSELMGHQSYALELPNGQSITLDWLAPEALPFFVGVNIWEATKGAKEEANLSTILKAVSSISEPMLEMSCLQSLNDLFESVGYATSNDTSGLVTILSSAATSYLAQGIPTILGQAERTGEENRMTTYTEKNAFLTSDMQYTLGKASAKIPFWDYQQIPYIDAWGRKEASGVALKRGFNNFLNPAYTSTVEESKMEKELLRLFEKTGESSVFPKRADKYFTVDGKRKDLTADEYVRYATLKGEKSHSAVTSLVNSNAYKKLTDSEKVKAIEDAYDYANQKAKKAISSGYKTDTWVSTADAFGINVGNFLSFRSEVSNTKQERGGKLSKQDVVDIVIDMAQNDSEAWKMYLSMYDSTSDAYAYDNGIAGGTYMSFLESLNDVDTPTDSGKYGTYTQKEATNAINQLEGLSRDEKAVLWQSVNQNWKAKNNPFR